MQDACSAALAQWPAEGVPSSPRGWLIGVARHKALDQLRREARRAPLEAEAARDWASSRDAAPGGQEPDGQEPGDEELALIFMCCHPALDPQARIALTLRCVCGLATADIAAAFVVPEPTMAQRLARARRKIRQAGIRLKSPDREDLPRRLAAVLRVIYLVFTQGHRAAAGPDLIQGALCEQAIRLARALAALMPAEPEVAGLLALLLLTDARRDARTSDAGELVLLGDQDRGSWDAAKIAAGTGLLARALAAGRPGPYQVHAAIAACHLEPVTDWGEIAGLYGELARYAATAVTEANRAVAVAMAEGPAAGLAILDPLAPRLARWPQFHIARAELLSRPAGPGKRSPPSGARLSCRSRAQSRRFSGGASTSSLGVEVGEHGQDAAIVILGGRQAQLGEDAGAVLADGLLRDEQPLGDSPVGAALRHQLQHLALPGGERGDRLVALAPGHEPGDDLRVEHRAAARHGADRVGEPVVVEHPVLQQVADRPGLVGEELAGVKLLDVLREHEDRQARDLAARLDRRLEALVGEGGRQPHIDDRDVRPLLDKRAHAAPARCPRRR